VFTVVGEALLDMVQPKPGNLYQALPAGGPLNIAIGLRRLGHPTTMMARFSAGALGSRVREYAEANDLDLSASVTTDQPATLAFATVDEQGRADYDFYVSGTADWDWTEPELAALPPATRAIHTGSLAAALPPSASRIAAWWETHSQGRHVLLSFDPNIRPALAGEREVAVRRVERFVANSHVVKASDEDLAWLYPTADPSDVVRHWAARGPLLTVLTRGREGCFAVTAGSGRSDAIEVSLPAPHVSIADTIGAGDAFQAGLLSGLADAAPLSPDGVAALTESQVRRVLERALDVARLTCERAGANPPTRAEYEAALARHPDDVRPTSRHTDREGDRR
jgi:fructokinase